MSEQRLFVYGTLAPGQPNEHVLAPLQGSWHPASVRGTLHPKGWGAALGYPAIVLDEKGTMVEGQIFSSEQLPDHWNVLDEFEGSAYQRVTTLAQCEDGSWISVQVYVLAESIAN